MQTASQALCTERVQRDASGSYLAVILLTKLVLQSQRCLN
jgi:hypothetical protein